MGVKWGKLRNDADYRTVHDGGKVAGWVVLIDDKWIARNAEGTIRADFDTMQEAQDFLSTMLNARGETE